MKQLLLASSVKKGTGRKVEVVAYNGGVMRVAGYNEVVLELNGLELPEQIKLVIDNREELDGVCGKGEGIVRDGQLIVTGELLENEAGQKVYDLLKNDIQLEASVGCEVFESEYIS